MAGANHNLTDSFGNSALMYAVHESHYDATVELCMWYPDLNAKNNEGKTPVLMAIDGNRIEILKTLVHAGASLEASEDGMTPLMYASRNARTSKEILELLQAHDNGSLIVNHYRETAIMYAATTGNEQNLKLLLETNAKKSSFENEINVKNKNGLTALMLAASRGHTKIVEQLLNAKADLNIEDQYDRTAFMLASYNNH